ncbi:MAG: hypothetical protein U0903_04240, partial [Planctomycetales bacterium]
MWPFSTTSRISIHRQILLPFSALLGLTVVLITVASAWIAARNVEQQTLTQLQHVVDSLVNSNYPLTNNVMHALRSLSGAHFVLRNSSGELIDSTFTDETSLEPLRSLAFTHGGLGDMNTHPPRLLGNDWYRVALVNRSPPSRDMLFVLYPVSHLRAARMQ